MAAKTASKNAPENRQGTQVTLCPKCDSKKTAMMVVSNRRKKLAWECKCGILYKDGSKAA